jgi:glycosyltransferase involved in cell wall biosynthesis
MEGKKPLLSICIPTYNRPDKIEHALRSLVELEGINLINIIVIDNYSDIEVKNIYEDIDCKLTNIRIIRNSVNIGGGANILRCIEFARTDWVWLLGDDDVPLKGSLKIILNDIERIIALKKNTVVLKYSSDLGSLNDSFFIDDYKTFFKFITINKYFSNFLFLSSTVINREIFCRYYAKAIENAISFSQIYPVFPLLYHKEADIFLSNRYICKWGVPEQQYHWFEGVVYQNMLRGFSSFFFMRSCDIRKIVRSWIGLSYKKVLGYSILMSIRGENRLIIKNLFCFYQGYLFSKLQRFFLYPVNLVFLFIVLHDNILVGILKIFKKYETFKKNQINIHVV